MPKMVVNSGNDEFFMPDDTHYWWANMPEPKHFLLMPNAEHTTATGALEELPAIKAFINAVLNEEAVPQFTWEIDSDTGDITVDVGDTKPHAVHMWHATTCNAARRDFRLINLDSPCTCGIDVKGKCLNLKISWAKTKLEEQTDRPGIYVASQDEPAVGWTAFFVDVNYNSKRPSLVETKLWQGERFLEEVSWPIDWDHKYEFTTLVSIVPNSFPYPTCKSPNCPSNLV